MLTLVERIVAIHLALKQAAVPHAFGGALALAWCTGQARATIDIDLNLFVPVEERREALAALPGEIVISGEDDERFDRDGQTRLWWNDTPVDVFLNTTPFHDDVARRARWETFGGEQVPFLACRDIAVFKAFFNRTRDWADLEAMAEAGCLDAEAVLGVLALHLGGDDPRVERLRGISLQR